MTSYPIDHILPQLKEALLHSSSVVLHAPPGAGKTTRVPLALLDLFPDKGTITMLEPRRIAAVSAARWMAKSLGEQAGETVGYAIRFDTKITKKTRIEVLTEGVLTRRIQTDPGLEGTSLVIFDEFHERSIHADLALALCLDIKKGLRPDLKILVMSATLDYGPIAKLLGDAPIIASQGKSFPVQERYLENQTPPLPLRIVSAVKTALRETNGDILVFLPGAGEIRASAKELETALNLNENRLSLHPLYGDLPFEEQEQAILPSKDRRKIVLATNIAETSLTIEGVHVVIDSGLTRMLRYDASTGMNRLMTLPVSRASAEQRKGRAGRLAPGVCYRLYSSHELKGMLAFTQPEILVSDLSPLALELAIWGVKDPQSLSWLDAPPSAAWNSGLTLLKNLGALDESDSVTPIGRFMSRLPLHPRLSRLMLRAQELGCVQLGADLAAILSEREIFRRNAEQRMGIEPDLSERLEAVRRGRRRKESDASVDTSALRAVERTASQLLRLMSGPNDVAKNDSIDSEMISQLLLSAFPDRICKRREEGEGFVHIQGRGVRLSKDSHLGNSPYIIAVNVDAGEKAEGFVHMAASVTEELIRRECASRIETSKRIAWDKKENRIIAAKEKRIGALLLSTKTFLPTDEETIPILCNEVRTTPELLSFSKEARQLQHRVGLIKKAFPEETWPDLSDAWLFSKPEEWLSDWLSNIRTKQQLASLNILSALKAKLSWEQGRLLDERAPLSILVPSGSRIMLDYATGELPVLAVKLQEMFGLADTPMIAAGRVKVLLHLLSPARRPIQITQDLKGFWNSAYQDVKKELKGRYPKHPWPDDPWNALPTRRAKPKGR